MNKTCSKCKTNKSVDNFRKRRAGYLSNHCRECERVTALEYANNHKEQMKVYRKANRDRELIRKKRTDKTYREKNLEKIKAYRKSISKLLNFHNSQRYASKLHRTPSYADLEAIKQFYLNCPKGMTVDHIIPMQGENVSGFHVLNNLQYLTQSDNSKKGNKFPYYPLSFYKEKNLIP